MILVFNAGSSSVKFSLYEHESLREAMRGEVEDLFLNPRLWVQEKGNKTYLSDPRNTNDAFSKIFEVIQSITKTQPLSGVAHRVVHGGKLYTDPVLIDANVLSKLREFIPLAPLHQSYNLEVIDRALAFFPGIPQVACFDTAFHRTQMKLAEAFPLPHTYTDEGIIRYGFHGLSYAYIASQLQTYVGDKAKKRVIVAHLGNGASLCAMKDLKSVSTSMGFTALDGLMMGTRTGSIDPGVILYLLQEKKMTVEEVTALLYHESGLKGVSGISADMKMLLKSDLPQAKSAIDLFCFTAARHMGSLLPVIGGMDILVFTAGIGENCPLIRRKICEYFQWMNLVIDPQSNESNAIQIHSPQSEIDVYVIPTNEEIVMAEAVKKNVKISS